MRSTTSRVDPPLRLHRLRISGELCELRDDDLHFSLAESGSLLANFGVEIGAGELALLHQRSEGWAAALQMAAPSLRGTIDPARAARALKVRSHTIVEYFISGLGARAIQERTQLPDGWNATVPLVLLRVYPCLEDYEAVEREAAAALALPELAEPARAGIWAARGQAREALATVGAARPLLADTGSVLLARADELPHRAVSFKPIRRTRRFPEVKAMVVKHVPRPAMRTHPPGPGIAAPHQKRDDDPSGKTCGLIVTHKRRGVQGSPPGTERYPHP